MARPNRAGQASSPTGLASCLFLVAVAALGTAGALVGAGWLLSRGVNIVAGRESLDVAGGVVLVVALLAVDAVLEGRRSR